jgi:hypothetical protein
MCSTPNGVMGGSLGSRCNDITFEPQQRAQRPKVKGIVPNLTPHDLRLGGSLVLPPLVDVAFLNNNKLLQDWDCEAKECHT